MAKIVLIGAWEVTDYFQQRLGALVNIDRRERSGPETTLHLDVVAVGERSLEDDVQQALTETALVFPGEQMSLTAAGKGIEPFSAVLTRSRAKSYFRSGRSTLSG
jgi:hypothetical protein